MNMNGYYFDWQEDGYYGGLESNNLEKVNTTAFKNNTYNIEVKARKRINFTTYALFALTASIASTLTAIGTLCLRA